MARRRIVISGASRGIGEALARDYAGPATSLVLVGRDGSRLDAVASACREAGAEVETLVLDILDRAPAAAELRRLDDAGPIDLLIANAGLHMPTSDDAGENDAAFAEIETNLLGTLNTIVPITTRMVARRRGQIAVMSSLAAYTPMADSPGYSASKAGLLAYGLSLRARMHGTGVKVSVVCPGYIDAGMGHRYKGRKMFLMPVGRTAATIRRGLESDRAVIAFPAPLAWMAKSVQLMPDWLRRIALRSSRFRVERPQTAKDDDHG